MVNAWNLFFAICITPLIIVVGHCLWLLYDLWIWMKGTMIPPSGCDRRCPYVCCLCETVVRTKRAEFMTYTSVRMTSDTKRHLFAKAILRTRIDIYRDSSDSCLSVIWCGVMSSGVVHLSIRTWLAMFAILSCIRFHAIHCSPLWSC